jgi:hypothetical protein
MRWPNGEEWFGVGVTAVILAYVLGHLLVKAMS